MHTSRLRKIALLALPIIGGMVSQNILNLVDTYMVGYLPNPNPALAAVNQSSFANYMCMALLLGISTGVQATASRRKGENKIDRMAVSLNAGILLVLLVAPLISAVLYFLVPSVYPYLNNDPEVVAIGVPYLRVRILAMVFVATNFAFRGYWNAINKSHLYMMTLLTMHISNIILNWLFIFGKAGFPEMGAVGAGVASALSTVIASGVYVFLGIKHASTSGFLRIMPQREEFSTLVRLSLPNGVQQLFFAAGFTALFFIIGHVGTEAMAAAGVLINVMLVAILPGIGLGLAAASLVGQALGRKDPDDAKRWGWDVVKVGMMGMGLLGAPMLFSPVLVLSPFLKDPVALELATLPLQMVGATIWFESVGLILMNALLGAGASKRVMIVSIVAQWVFFLPIAYVLSVVFNYGLVTLWGLQVLYRASLSVVFSIIWIRGRWASIEV